MPLREYKEDLSKRAVGAQRCHAGRLFTYIDWCLHARNGTIPSLEEFFTIPEAAAVLRQPVVNLYRHIQHKAGIPVAKGRLPRRLKGASLYLLWEDIVYYLQGDDTEDVAVQLAYKHWLDYCQKRLERTRSTLNVASNSSLTDSSDSYTKKEIPL